MEQRRLSTPRSSWNASSTPGTRSSRWNASSSWNASNAGTPAPPGTRRAATATLELDRQLELEPTIRLAPIAVSTGATEELQPAAPRDPNALISARRLARDGLPRPDGSAARGTPSGAPGTFLVSGPGGRPAVRRGRGLQPRLDELCQRGSARDRLRVRRRARRRSSRRCWASSILVARSGRVNRGVFDAAQFSLAAVAGASVFTLFHASRWCADPPARARGRAGAASTWSSTVGLLCLAMSLADEPQLLDVWRERFRWLMPYYLAPGPLALALTRRLREDRRHRACSRSRCRRR